MMTGLRIRTFCIVCEMAVGLVGESKITSKFAIRNGCIAKCFTKSDTFLMILFMGREYDGSAKNCWQFFSPWQRFLIHLVIAYKWLFNRNQSASVYLHCTAVVGGLWFAISLVKRCIVLIAVQFACFIIVKLIYACGCGCGWIRNDGVEFVLTVSFSPLP